MIHYHGGPITPDTCAIKAWKARHALISFAHPVQLNLAMQICQSFILDNGAFSLWKAGKQVDWPSYYQWVNQLRNHPRFDFAIIPDVIGGTEQENDKLLDEWPFPLHQGAAVWHINESFERLIRLAIKYPTVCIGSCAEWDVSHPTKFLARARLAISKICDANGQPICKLHGLRILNQRIFTQIPLSSADSTNVAINIGKDKNWRGTYQPQSKETRAAILVERIEHFNSACSLSFFNSADLDLIRLFHSMNIKTFTELAKMFKTDEHQIEEICREQ